MYFNNLVVEKHMHVIYTHIFEGVLKILTDGRCWIRKTLETNFKDI